MVIAQEADGQWKQQTKHADITKALIQEHTRKYQQTVGTPPMRAPIRQQLGYLGIGTEADKILQGNYERKPGTDNATATLLQHLARVNPTQPELPLGISTQDYQSGWKKIKERTSAGGSTLHFGHCKACSKDDDLSAMEAAFISIPLRSGYVFKAWKYGVDCVLPKKKNAMRVDALRTIVLLEADFNFLNKHVARKAMYQAECMRTGLAPEQYGSRKYFRAIDHVLNKLLSFDILRQYKQAGIVIPTDLKSCYDRICHSIASLSLRRQGVAESEVVCMFSTLQHLSHTIRCAYGTSTESYGDDIWAVPMQGVYQGNGAGPVIWAVVSSPVLQILRQEGYGAFFKAAISGEAIRLVGYAFVDDTDLIQTGTTIDATFDEVFQLAQDELTRWEALISATGGALAVSKCRWWAIAFAWNDDGSWQYRREVELPGILKVRDHDGQIKRVQRLDVDEAYETLGVFLAPNGNHAAEYAYLLGKATKWADKLRASTLRDQETATALKATILKTLEYPLPVLFLTETECKKIMATVLKAALPKSRFNRNFCRRTLYAPGSHGGQEIPNLKTSQTIAHVDAVLRHGMADTLAGKQLRGSIQAAKLELGLPGALFQHNAKDFAHLLTNGWVKSAWIEFHSEGLSVEEQTPSLKPTRTGDQFLIAAFRQAGFRGKPLLRLNRCRLRLKVVTLADLCSGDGRYMLLQALQDPYPVPALRYEWMHQGPLPPSDWQLWKRALKKTFHLQAAGKLPIPLGRWIAPSKGPHSWHDALNADTYVPHHNQWIRFHHRTTGFGQTRTFDRMGLYDRCPPHCRKAVAWVQEGTLQFHGSAPLAPSHTTLISTLPQAVQALEPDWKWALEYLEWNTAPHLLAEHIRAGRAKGIADGSFKDQKGTAAFAIVGPDGHSGVYGMHRTPGPSYSQCSYRSENGGILGILLVCKLLHQAYSLQGGSLMAGCDNLESGKFCLVHTQRLRPSDDHYDILDAARTLHDDIPFRLQYTHVEGHQRTKYPGRPLDDWATLNENMDALAKAYWRHTETWDRPLRCQPNEWIATHQGHRIITQFRKRLTRQIASRELELKWTRIRGTRREPRPPLFSPAQLAAIDKVVIQRAWGSIEGNRRRYVTKLITAQLPTGRRMHQYGFWTTSQCPLCLRANETTAHCFCCTDKRAHECRQTAFETLEKGLTRLHTATNITHGLMILVRFAVEHTPIDMDDIVRDDVRLLLGQQLSIGPQSVIYGRLSTGWAQAQSRAFQNYSPWRSGEQWAAKTIVLLWDFTFSLWTLRNTVLHDKPENHPDIDPESVDYQILEEWSIGPDPSWDHGGRTLFKGITCEQILAQTLPQRRQWLQYVHLAREYSLETDMTT